MLKRCSLFVLLVLVAAAVAQDSKPNFSGAWQLVVEKSDFGQPTPWGPRFPAGVTAQSTVIEHRDGKIKMRIKVQTPEGETAQERSYSTDGVETTDTIHGVPATSRVRWDGRDLVTEVAMEFDQEHIYTAVITARWRLSDDGTTLTNERTMKHAGGETKQKLVFVKKT